MPELRRKKFPRLPVEIPLEHLPFLAKPKHFMQEEAEMVAIHDDNKTRLQQNQHKPHQTYLESQGFFKPWAWKLKALNVVQRRNYVAYLDETFPRKKR